MGNKKPGVPKQPKAAKRVRVSLGDTHADFQGRVNVQKGLRSTAPNSPKFNATIKSALDNWSKDTDQAVSTYDDIINLEAQLEQKYGTLGTILLQVNQDRDVFIGAVENVCTSAADVKSFGANESTPAKRVEPTAPTEVRQIETGVPGANRFRWPSEPGAGAYKAETSADPPSATSYAEAYTGKSPFFLFTGTPGQKIWVRVASIGSAPSAWSTPLPFILK